MEQNEEYYKFFDLIQRNNEQPMSSMYISFINENDEIVYELTDYYNTYLGCMKYAYLEYYGDKLCQRMVALDYPSCLSLSIVAGPGSWDFLRILYNKDGNISYLGSFSLQINYSYTMYTNEICWDCSSGFYNNSSPSLGGIC